MSAEDIHPIVAGHVVLRDGTPVLGAKVVESCRVRTAATRAPGGHYRYTATHRGRNTLTDDTGGFRFERMGRGESGFFVYRDEIIGLDYEIPNDADVENLRIEVLPRVHFELVLAKPTDRADGVAVIDADGRALRLQSTSYSTVTTQHVWPLHEGRSGVLVVLGEARHVVLLRGELPIAKIPVVLRWREENVVRY